MKIHQLIITTAAALVACATLCPTASAAADNARAAEKMRKKILAGELASDARLSREGGAPSAESGAMESRSWMLSPLLVAQACKDFLPSAPAQPTNAEELDALEQFLRASGVSFPAGSNIKFNHCGSLLTVVNSPANLEAVNAALLEEGEALLEKARQLRKEEKKGAKKRKRSPRRSRRG